MINKLCIILAVAPLIILYIVKCIENKYWITVPLGIIICMGIMLGVTMGTVYLFQEVLGWFPHLKYGVSEDKKGVVNPAILTIATQADDGKESE